MFSKKSLHFYWAPNLTNENRVFIQTQCPLILYSITTCDRKAKSLLYNVFRPHLYRSLTRLPVSENLLPGPHLRETFILQMVFTEVVTSFPAGMMSHQDNTPEKDAFQSHKVTYIEIYIHNIYSMPMYIIANG